MNKYEFIISAKDETAKAFGNINRRLNITSGKAARMGGAVAAAAAGMLSLTVRASKGAKELGLLANLAGMTVSEFQSTSYALSQFNITQEELADISKDVQDKLGDFIATGGGEFSDFFENIAPKVGITAESLKELSGPQVLIAVKKAMDDANVSAKEQVFYLESIANDATKLSPLLEKNGKRLKELKNEYDSLNIALSETDTENLIEFNNQVIKLQNILDGIGNKLAASLVSPLSDFNDGLSEISEESLLRVERVMIGFGRSTRAALTAWYELQESLGFSVDTGYLEKLRFETAYLDKQWERLTQKLNGTPIPYSLGQGETDDIFAGLDNPFDLSGALTNVQPITEALKGDFLQLVSAGDELNQTLASSKDLLAFNAGDPFGLNEMMDLDSATFWQEYEQNGIQAYANLTEHTESFWESWLNAANENLQNFDELSATTIEAFSHQRGSAFESVVFESDSMGDALKGVAQGVARSTVNAIGQMAAQWLAYQAVQLLVGKSTAVAGASGLALNAQAMSLMAGLNAFTSTAAIPIVGPPAAPAAMGAALSVTQPIATAISSLSASAAVASFDGGGYTPSGARIGGIDNKGGRLAVLHPNEKVTDLTKSTSPTSLVINTTTNVHGSGDDEAVIRAIERNPKKIARIINRLSGTPV